MNTSNDHRVEVYLDPVTYIALRARVADCDRTISQHIRHLIRRDLEASIAHDAETGRRGEGVSKGEA